MINYIKNLFSFQKKKTKEIDNSILDIIISLNNTTEIDISVFIDDDNAHIDHDMVSYAEKCAEFLHIVNSGKLKKQILDIFINKIKKQNNQLLIDNIVTFWSIIEKEKRNTKSERSFISPRDVFSRNITK